MNWRCRWLGHKRRSLDGDANGVSIRNVDACDRCGQSFVAKKARDFSYEDHALHAAIHRELGEAAELQLQADVNRTQYWS